jgi:hypothetical protein
MYKAISTSKSSDRPLVLLLSGSTRYLLCIVFNEQTINRHWKHLQIRLQAIALTG